MITAKVKLQGSEENGSDQTTLFFVADYDDNRNKEWAEYTPYLGVTMVVKNSVAEQKAFEPGNAFELRFIPEAEL